MSCHHSQSDCCCGNRDVVHGNLLSVQTPFAMLKVIHIWVGWVWLARLTHPPSSHVCSPSPFHPSTPPSLHPHRHTVREELRELAKEFDKSEDDLKSLQSGVGQIVGEVLRQLTEDKCEWLADEMM